MAPRRAAPWVWLVAVFSAAAQLGCSSRDGVGQLATGGAAGMSAGAGGGRNGNGGSAGSAGGAGMASAGGAGTGGGGGAGGGPSTGANGGDSTGPGAGGGGAGGAPVGAGGAGGAPLGAGGGTADLSGGVEWEPWPAIDPAPANSCAVTWLIGGDRSSPPKSVLKETWEYDAGRRVLTRHHAANGASAAWDGYVRFDAQGRRELICHAQADFACQDWTRDALGNAKAYSFFGVVEPPLDARALDPAHPPVKAAIAGGESETDRLTYDDLGRLATATYYFPMSGAQLTFGRDAQGRCSDVTWAIPTPMAIELDHWTYVGDKLASRVVTNMSDPKDVRAVMTYGYDSDGALALTVVDGRLEFPAGATGRVPKHPRDGVPDYVVRTVKQPDGSRWIETLDFELDTNNAMVTRGGTPTPAFRYRWYLSPACEALALPRHTSQDCEFERPTPMMPLGWHNPLSTPIQMWIASPLPD